MVIAARGWLATYERAWLRADVVAGVTLAAYILPSGLADASLAKHGIEFRLAEVHGVVREALRRLGDAHASTLAEANRTVDDVLSTWRAAPAGVMS